MHAPAAAANVECQIFLDAVRGPTPRFGDFPTPVERIARPAPIDLDPQARAYRTTLRQARRRGVNFAGHFSLATFGCGAGSLCWGIVDLRSGKVGFPKPGEISSDRVGARQPRAAKGTTDLISMRFRADSALLVLLGAPDEDESAEGVNFYRWTGVRLAPVMRVPASRACRNVRVSD